MNRGWRETKRYSAPSGQPQNPPFYMPAIDRIIDPIFIAIIDHDLETLQKLINDNNIDKAFCAFSTPLMLAIEHYSVNGNTPERKEGYKKIIDFLIAKGANVNAISSYNGITALMLAVFHDLTDIVELLIANKADPYVWDSRGFCLLYYFIYDRNERKYTFEILKIILKDDINSINKQIKKEILKHIITDISGLVMDYLELTKHELITLFWDNLECEIYKV